MLLERKNETHKWTWLAAGTALSVLSNLRFGIPELAWFASAPFLVHGILFDSRRDRIMLFISLLISASLMVAKIVTPPVGFWMIPLFSFPIGISSFILLLLALFVYRRLGPQVFVPAFAALSAAFEWLTYTFSEQSSWGSLAFTQADRLELVQTGSIAGIAGLSFVAALPSAAAAVWLVNGLREARAWSVISAALFLAANLYGSVRLLDEPSDRSVRIAAVASAVTAAEIPHVVANPSLAESKEDLLFARSKRASELGARVIVWTEAGTLVLPERAQALIDRAQNFARSLNVHLVLGAAVLVSKQPVQMENKYLWIRPDGSIADEYWKRHPVPGEGSIKGRTQAALINVDGIQMAGAICYDLDFPHISRELAKAGAEIIVVPSSDWRGIDPLHSRMARYMGTASGVSVVRSVRSAESFASDDRGRILASMPAAAGNRNSPEEGIMIAQVPAGSASLYAGTGDWFAWLCAAGSVAAVLLAAVRRR